MIITDSQIQFAAEFVLFLVAMAGITMMVLRGDAIVRGLGRPALVAGFAALATTAFLHGSRLVDDASDPGLVAASVGGLALLAAGSARWRAGRDARIALWVGTAVLAAAAMAAVAQADTAGAILRALGAAGVGVALVLAARRSIVAKIAVSAATTLLLVVLVISVALSAVLSSTVEDQAVLNLEQVGQSETRQVDLVVEPGLFQAVEDAHDHLLTRANQDPTLGDELRARDSQPARSPIIENELAEVSDSAQRREGTGLAYLTVDRTVVAATRPLEPPLFTALSGSTVVAGVLDARDDDTRVSVEIVLGDEPWAIAAKPVRGRIPEGGTRRLGVLVAARPLDSDYLALRQVGLSQGTTLGFATGQGIVAAGDDEMPDARTVRALAASVLATGEPDSEVGSDWIVVAQPVLASDDTPVLALIAADPTTVVTDLRESLFRTLFLIALGGAVLALVLAAFVGDRIGANLRRLTTAAEAVQRGDEGVRARIVAEDEVGVLGGAFDSMVAANEDKAAALRQAADDETRLRNRLEAVVAGVGEALIAVDVDGVVTDFNHAAEVLVGCAASEAKGRPIEEVVTGTTDDGLAFERRLQVPSRRWSTTGVVQSRSGEEIPVAASAGILVGSGEGELAGGVYVFRDLRREREVERMKTEFLSRVGHELRTPLAPIVGYSTILATRDAEPERVREVARNIHASAERLARIVQMLEFFASSQAGRNVLRPEEVDLRELVAGLVQRWAGRASQHEITRRVSRKVGPLQADPKWIDISLDELVDNAVKFSPQGGPVRVTVQPAENGEVGVQISVTDRGKGMTGDEIERAFTEFAQGDESDTRHFGGLGLGLALVREVVERHGGRVEASSQGLGQGSKFSIFLPTVPIHGEDEGSSRRARAGYRRSSDDGADRGVGPQ